MDDLHQGIQARVREGSVQPAASPISNALPKFFNSKTFSDVTLVTAGGKKLHCHKLVLAACSDRLCKLLGQDHSSSTVEIPCMDVEPEALENLVQFLYTSSCDFTIHNVVPILCTARKYGVPQLENRASAYAQSQISVQSCCKLLLKAADGGCERLKIQCLALAADRLDEVSQTEGFLSLSITELKRLLKNPELLSCSELALFKAMCSWVLRDISRLQHLEDIQATVNFPQLDPDQSKSVRELLYARHNQALHMMSSPSGPPTSCASPGGQNSGENPSLVSFKDIIQGADLCPDDEKLEIPLIQATPSPPTGVSLPSSMPEQLGAAGNGRIKTESSGSKGAVPSVVEHPAGVVSTGSPGSGTGVSQQLKELFVAHLMPEPMNSTVVRESRDNPNPERKRTEGQGGEDVASGTDETGERIEAGSRMSVGNNHCMKARGNPSCTKAARSICQVEGCGAALEGLRDYHVRYKICDHHLKISSIIKDGKQQRFCQQCGRFHSLMEFDGIKRSCRSRLMRHNARRRKRLKTDSEEKSLVATPMVSASTVPATAQPLICVLPSGQSTTAKIVPRSSVTFSPLPSNTEQWRDHLPVQLGQLGYPITQVAATFGDRSPAQTSQLIQAVRDSAATPNCGSSPGALGWFPAFGVVSTAAPTQAEVDLSKLPSASQVVTGQVAPVTEDGPAGVVK